MYLDTKESRSIILTQKKLLYALESIFLIRRLKIEGSVRSEAFYLEDQAESNYTSQNELSESEYFEQLIYRNLRVLLYYNLGLSFREFCYMTRSGVRVPYAIECNGYNLGIIPTDSEVPSRSEKAVQCIGFCRVFSK